MASITSLKRSVEQLSDDVSATIEYQEGNTILEIQSEKDRFEELHDLALEMDARFEALGEMFDQYQYIME